ncbi:c-type cytochrome biogenesis protein CcmI [Pseudomonas sp. MTM4]|uniref:c-type cytochrome biogenesis protein CcmI n=1 Tax=unclassified Pseudomonas TaxID=196821 RepID=UPI0018D226D7|nr:MULTISPECIES: c-type cytochrome biogenesis protein CcmI [unclassified Pseudomonas]MBC8651736.1 c-type cytochrome biogenesis protein CcmI [Pseudomonas sp. MT4]QXY91372.1 c-type cytochrome biogenesis protein CcmI [Pseudomonas sp. MTM4]
MIDFWIGAGLLLLAALAFLLLPVLRGRRLQAEEDRTALNVALYQERLGELTAQQAAGTLTLEQYEMGRADAARELLDDTEGSDAHRSSNLGRAVPLIVAILVPLFGYGLYMHWGASDKLQLTREFAVQPGSIEEMTARLERAVKAQPESSEAWYFLARTYMSQERPADAAAAYEQVVNLAGRQPELLGQWAQALYFAEGRSWTPRMQRLTDEALQADPHEVTSLGLLGIAAYENERFDEAIGFWERLVATLPAEDPSREAIQGGIARAREQLGETASGSGSKSAGEPVAASSAALTVDVQLGAALVDKVKPTDTVFVFARAVSGPPMPLAVKRLTVADLPATVSLSDADAMTPQLRLSNFEQVRLFARVSRDGDATRGEWQGSSEPLTLNNEDAIELTIDQPEAP